MVVSFSLFSLLFCHGNALYSSLLLIFCFVFSLMVGFHHSFWRVSSPFHDLLLHSVSNGGEFFTFFSLFMPWKRALLLSPTHSPFLLPSDGRIPPQFLARFFAIPRSAPNCKPMLVSFLIFRLFFA